MVLCNCGGKYQESYKNKHYLTIKHTEWKKMQINKSIVEPVIESINEPIIESINEPIIESVIEPIIESVIEPIIESVIEPIFKPVIKPIVCLTSTFANQLTRANIIPMRYLEEARRRASKYNLNENKLYFSSKEGYKLNYDGVDFGIVNFKDNIINKNAVIPVLQKNNVISNMILWDITYQTRL